MCEVTKLFVNVILIMCPWQVKVVMVLSILEGLSVMSENQYNIVQCAIYNAHTV